VAYYLVFDYNTAVVKNGIEKNLYNTAIIEFGFV